MISEGTAEAVLLFGYSNPLVRSSDWQCTDFRGFGCLELCSDLKIEQFQELAVYLEVKPKCPQQRSFGSLFRVFFRSDPLHSRTECEFLKINLVKHMVLNQNGVRIQFWAMLGSNVTKCIEKYIKLAAQGSIWGHLDAL